MIALGPLLAVSLRGMGNHTGRTKFKHSFSPLKKKHFTVLILLCLVSVPTENWYSLVFCPWVKQPLKFSRAIYLPEQSCLGFFFKHAFIKI